MAEGAGWGLGLGQGVRFGVGFREEERGQEGWGGGARGWAKE